MIESQHTSANGTMLRVLHFIDRLGPGGRERQLVEMLKGFEITGGCESLVVSMTAGVFYEELNHVRGVVLKTLIRRWKKDPLAFLGLYRLVREFRPDLLVAWDHMTAVYAIPATLLARVPLVNAMIRDAPARLTWRAWSRARVTFPFSRAILANSQAGLDAYGVHSKRGVVIRNGMDSRRLRQLEDPRSVRERWFPGSRLVVGMVSTFRPWKDHPTLIRAAERLLGHRKDVVFVMVGDGETLEQCRRLVPAELRDDIRFAGAVGVGLESLVNAFDIGVLATFTEGIPNAVMEYMALSKPVVATDGGGTRELMQDGVTGFLVPARDAAALAGRIERLLDDPGLRETMGAAGRRRVVEEFSLEQLVRRHRTLYEQVAGRGAHRLFRIRGQEADR